MSCGGSESVFVGSTGGEIDCKYNISAETDHGRVISGIKMSVCNTFLFILYRMLNM